MGKKQESMEDEKAIGYGLIPEILGPVLVGYSMSVRNSREIGQRSGRTQWSQVGYQRVRMCDAGERVMWSSSSGPGGRGGV